jgi:cytoskeletal protein CcmA (bactofilin family)
MDYAAAKTTMCRQCGRSFSPGTPKVVLKLASREEPAPIAAAPTGLRSIGGMWNRGQRMRLVACFECKRRHEVSEAATSTNCPGCSAHIDLRDYKITTSFSRSIRTRGDVQLTNKGDLNSTSVVCRTAMIEGRLRGNLECEESATVNFVGKIPGRLTANYVCIERKADVQCFRRMRVGSIDIKGRLTGEIIASGTVNIHKTGVLDGDVTAKSINIDQGGLFSGQLVIGQAALMQGELLAKAEEKAAKAKADEQPELPAASAQPLPAT